MSKIVKFFVDGHDGNEIQQIELFEKMSISEIETSIRKAALVNDNDNIVLYSPPKEPQKQPIIAPFYYDALRENVHYKLVVIAKPAGKI